MIGDPALKVWTDNPVVGISQAAGEFTCTLSPNPCKDQLNVSYTLKTPSVVRMIILNSLGQPVSAKSFDDKQPGNHTVSFNVAGYAPGIYNCRLETKDNSVTRKLMVVR